MSPVFLLIPLSFVLLKDSRSGLSLWKKVKGIQVIDVKTGLPIGVKQSILRNTYLTVCLRLMIIPVSFAPIVSIFLLFVNLIVTTRDRYNRSIGDRIAGTLVVRRMDTGL